MDGYSLDLTRQGTDIIKKYFPDVITEGRIDFQRLQLALGEDLAVTDHYELTWAGKAQARREIQKRTTCTLHPDFEESLDFENSENIYIEGENLEVLRILQNSYFGKVKMIYIDPPYNTGNDSFVYPDDYSERKAEYQLRTGRTDEEGFLNKFDLFRTNNGQLHSPWLSMMYPRLYMARNLLREDGVIFVSIDDNEQSNLKLLMDEIFGEENFVGVFTWKKRTGSNDSKNFVSIDHEYVICYSKFEFTQLNGIEKEFENYTNPDNDPRGDWTRGDLTCNKTASERPNLYYPITDPETGISYPANPNRVWAYEKNRMERIINEGKVLFPKEVAGTPTFKRHKSEVRSGRKPFSSVIDTSINAIATKETREILGGQYFDFPKGVNFLKQLIEQSTSFDQNHIILDFFGGSGTTAQAVLELNAECGGNRKFIMVQFAEPTEEKGEAYNNGLKNIAMIGRERIKRVANRISKTANETSSKAEDIDSQIHQLWLEKDKHSAAPPEVFDKAQQSSEIRKIEQKIDNLAQQAAELRHDTQRYEQVDKGFKAFKLGISNFKTWQKDGSLTDKQVQNMTLDFRDPVRSTAKSYPMLVEFMLKNGLPLTASIQEIDAAGVPVYTINKNELWVLLDRYEDGVREVILEERPKRVVCLDRLFAGNDQLLTNLHLELRERNIELTVI